MEEAYGIGERIFDQHALGVGAFYPAEVVTISGIPKQFTRASASGGEVRGSTVCWKADNLPALIGVAVGAFADPKCPDLRPPSRTKLIEQLPQPPRVPDVVPI